MLGRERSGWNPPPRRLAAVGALVLAVAGATALGARPGPVEPGAEIAARRLRGLRPAVVRQILAGAEGGELATAVLALTLPGAGEEARVALFVEIDGAGFLEHTQSAIARVEVYVYALDAGGRVAGYLAEAFAVDVRELGERLWQGGLKFRGGLDLPAGEYALRVLVRNHDSGAHGLRRLALEVPEAAARASLLLPPLCPAPEGRDSWVPVRASGSGEAGTPYPLVVGGRAFVPEAWPVFVSGRAAAIHLLGRKLPAAAGARLEILADRPGAEVLASVPATLRKPAPADPGSGLEAAELRFSPPDLPPGPYRIRPVGDADGPRRALAPPARVVIVGPGTRERGLLWSDLRWMLPAGDAAIAGPRAASRGLARPPARPGRRRAGRAVRRLAERYRDVVSSRLRDPEAARTRLFQLESEALGRGRPRALEPLRAAQLSVAEELAASDVECLLPLLELHADMVDRYRGRRLYSLVFHARAMVEILTERYAELGGSAAHAARALSWQAGSLQQAHQPAGSRRLFSRALEHDAAAPSALLGLAASFEKYSQYASAVEVLERLVELEPALGEARLRLAVNLARQGRSARAWAHLERIVADDRRDWVCVVAHQELARMALGAGDAGAATALMEAAVKKMPARPGLRFLLAHLYDRQGWTRASLEQLHAIGPTMAADVPAARRRYDEWPREELERARRELRAAAAAATGPLARALEASGGRVSG